MQCYASTNNADNELKPRFFFDSLNHVFGSIGGRDLTILMGDFNTKIEDQNVRYEDAMGKQGVGKIKQKWQNVCWDFEC